jgi:hypothetical protein
VRNLWTSEGNVGDCVKFMKRSFFVGGVLDASIDGVGHADALFTRGS